MFFDFREKKGERGWGEKHQWETNTDRCLLLLPTWGGTHALVTCPDWKLNWSTGWLSNQLNPWPGLLLLLKPFFQSGKRDKRLKEQEIDCYLAGALFVNSQGKIGKLLCGVWGKHYKNYLENKATYRATSQKCILFSHNAMLCYFIIHFPVFQYNLHLLEKKKWLFSRWLKRPKG